MASAILDANTILLSCGCDLFGRDLSEVDPSQDAFEQALARSRSNGNRAHTAEQAKQMVRQAAARVARRRQLRCSA